MSDSINLSTFEKRLAERRAKEEAQKNSLNFDEDLVPEQIFEETEADVEIDRIIDKIDIIEAYNRWCGKMIPVVKKGQKEGIKISCPIPGHVDSDPSAWVEIDKQVWFCGKCQEGGDKFDIAAYKFGFPVPGYKDGVNFHKLRERMAEDYGYRITKLAGGAVAVIAPEPTTEPEDEPIATVTEIEEPEEDEVAIPNLPWRKITPPDTFLDAYMKATVIDDVPEEYHFFHALLAIGFALGRDVTLFDAVPVYGNLFVCTLGRSGTGKSKARYHLDSLLTDALPHDWSNPASPGVRKISSPGSAEVLIHNFMKPVTDPSDPRKILYYAPVRGLIDFNELSSLMARANRQGSAIKPTLMQFYDMEKIVATSSMTHGLKEAYEPFASALTTSQPKALRDVLSSSDDASGFLNRWVFIPGKPKRRFSVGGVAVDVSSATKPLQDILGWTGTFLHGEQVEWGIDALNLFDSFFHDQMEVDKKRSEMDLIVRIDLTMKKLILLFAANRKEKTVSKQSVEDAMTCYPFLVSAYGIPQVQIGNTLTNEITNTILHFAKKYEDKHGKGITLFELNRSLRRRKYSPKMVGDAIDALVKIDMLKVQNVNAGRVGRPTVRYSCVD